MACHASSSHVLCIYGLVDLHQHASPRYIYIYSIYLTSVIKIFIFICIYGLVDLHQHVSSRCMHRLGRLNTRKHRASRLLAKI